jgi:hypothetical protein
MQRAAHVEISNAMYDSINDISNKIDKLYDAVSNLLPYLDDKTSKIHDDLYTGLSAKDVYVNELKAVACRDQEQSCKHIGLQQVVADGNSAIRILQTMETDVRMAISKLHT